MRLPSSLKLIAATWIAGLIGALAGRALAEASRPGHDERAAAIHASAPPLERVSVPQVTANAAGSSLSP